MFTSLFLGTVTSNFFDKMISLKFIYSIFFYSLPIPLTVALRCLTILSIDRFIALVHPPQKGMRMRLLCSVWLADMLLSLQSFHMTLIVQCKCWNFLLNLLLKVWYIRHLIGPVSRRHSAFYRQNHEEHPWIF